MNKLRTLFLAYLASALFFVPAGAQDLRTNQTGLTPEIALDVRNVRIASMTDDGRWLAATVQTRRDRTDVDHRRFGDPTYIPPTSMRLLVIDLLDGSQHWVHEDPERIREITWSPVGHQLAYLLVDGEHYTLRVWDSASLNTWEVTLSGSAVIASNSSLVWAPDGESMLLSLRPSGWVEDAKQAFYDVTEAPVIVQDSRNDFLAWDRVRNLSNEHVTALVDLSDGSFEELFSDVMPQDIGFSPDGSVLTFSTATRTKTTYTRRDGTDYGVFKLALRTGERTALVEPNEKRTRAIWTEDRSAFAYADDGAVWVRDLNAGEATDVTAGLRGEGEDSTKTRYSVEGWDPAGNRLLLTSDEGWFVLDVDEKDLNPVLSLEAEEALRPRREPVTWTDDGDHLYYSFSERGRWNRGLKRLDVRSGAVTDIVLDDGVYRSWTISSDGSTIVFSRSDGDRPDDLWIRRSGDGDLVRLTDVNPHLDDVAFARTELVEYLDVDGNKLHGILYYPDNYEDGKTYPLVAEIYEEFFDNGYHENMNLITAQGWFGLRPSVAFEEGYPGEAWLKAVPTAINSLIERGLVDGEKVGVYGQSYGGYAVNLLITQTDRFAAAANVSGKVNIISFLGDSPRITTRNYAAAEVGQDRIGATLWEQPHKYIQTSAVMFADRIDTPLLMLSGEGDWNVPDTNQREMYYALRRLGKEVVWVNYTRGGHGAGRASTAEDFVDHWNRMFEWFRTHFDDSTPATS